MGETDTCGMKDLDGTFQKRPAGSGDNCWFRNNTAILENTLTNE